MGATERGSAHAFAVPRERRALPAGVDVQDGDRLRRARERARAGQRVAEPARARPPADDGVIENFGGGTCPGGATTTLLTAFTNSLQRDLRRGRAGARGRTRSRRRRTRTASARPIRPRRPGASSRRSRSRSRSRPGGSRSRATSKGTIRSSRSSAIGQDNDLANPLQMALVASAIANRGVMMAPRLVTQIRDPQGRVIREFDPEPYGQPISREDRDGDCAR